MEKRKQIILVVLFVVSVLLLILATIAGKAIAADKENADTTTTTTTIATTTTSATTTVATAKTTKKAVVTTTAKTKTKVTTTAPIETTTTTTTAPTETTTTTSSVPATYWDGEVLTPTNGRIEGPSGQETYYNLDMSGVLNIMYDNGFSGGYWVRDDGCKMFGDYIMVAADLSIRPRGSIVQTSLGWGIVCDTGTFTYSNPYQLDIATCW